MKFNSEILTNSSKVDYFEQLFENLDCSLKTIQNKLFEKCKFTKCKFDEVNFIGCSFVDCEFIECSMNTIVPTNTTFLGVVFDNSKMMGIQWPKAKWPRIKLVSPINFYACDISYSNFFGLSLSEINIQGCKVHDADFREADLSHGNLTNSDFFQSLFIHTKLFDTDFSEALNYSIDLKLNDVKRAIFSFPEVINLLVHFDIKIKGWEHE